ncbi:MAG: ParB/RepB/Spo0J family partition protein [Clostridia bacterium]|nr:ParB/RepB/Spo0J family partition protein [Clostridia bacterium]MBQ8268817.1 ParB/RepB/Spo0J family partition protein [Clostridia bacterium]MBR2325492.1 ParB/RepB/Spo0J family partition protein [Clostridia bacterium]
MPRKKNSGLGRGLDAIFLDNSLTDDAPTGEGSVIGLKLSLIDPRADQPRKNFDEEALQGLANSILKNGVFQPILVREYGEGRYQIIAGERRFRASKMAGLSEIPAIILDKDNQKTAQIALIENIQREDLNPIEEAMAYRSLADEYNMTQEELSSEVGKSRSAIANALRLLDLPDDVLALVAGGALSAGHARTLLGVKDPANLIALANAAIEKGWSVRVLEEEVKRINRPIRTAPVKEAEALPLVDYRRELELNLQRRFGRQVRIKDGGKKKCLCFFYEDNVDLTELLDSLCGENFES